MLRIGTLHFLPRFPSCTWNTLRHLQLSFKYGFGRCDNIQPGIHVQLLVQSDKVAIMNAPWLHYTASYCRALFSVLHYS